MADPDPDCPLCHGPYPDDLVERIKSAKPVGEPVTAQQFMEWLEAPRSSEENAIGKDPSHCAAPFVG